MKTLLHGLLLSLCLLPSLLLAEEAIEEFAVELQVQADGSLLVTERISVRAEGQQIRRGIYRDLPTRYRSPLGLEQQAPIELLGVTRDGQPEQVKVERQGAWLRFYLGSPEQLLTPGRYQYELRYRTERQLLHRDGEDELYWNVTGNGWSFPIQQVSVEVRLPQGARIGKLAAYTGAEGEQGQAYRLVEQREAGLHLVSTEVLPAYHGLTLAVDWQAGLVARPGALQALLHLLLDNPGLSLGSLLLLGLFGYYLRAWRRVGRDPDKGLVIPLFSAPPGLSPAAVGYLWHRGFKGPFSSARAFGVWLTELAIRKQLQLEDSPRSGSFVLNRGAAAGAGLNADEEDLLLRLFPADKAEQPLPVGGSYQPRLADALGGLCSQLQAQGKPWFSHNRGIWSWGLAWAIGASLLMVFVGAQGEEEWGLGIAGLVFGLGFGVPSGVLLSIAWQQPSWAKKLGMGLAGLMFVWPVPVGLWMLSEVASLPVIGLLGLYLLLVLLFYHLLPAPSLEGRRLLDALEGYRDYLQLAESDSLALAGAAPAMSIELYEQHLPYAMALDVEDQWSARFSAALASGLIAPAQRDYQPDWYHSRTRFDSPQSLSSALASGLSSATASASSPPASSSSSGGSSGGGSSGGGRGGGGGGGW